MVKLSVMVRVSSSVSVMLMIRQADLPQSLFNADTGRSPIYHCHKPSKYNRQRRLGFYWQKPALLTFVH